MLDGPDARHGSKTRRARQKLLNRRIVRRLDRLNEGKDRPDRSGDGLTLMLMTANGETRGGAFCS
jgi:hypothetical protein